MLRKFDLCGYCCHGDLPSITSWSSVIKTTMFGLRRRLRSSVCAATIEVARSCDGCEINVKNKIKIISLFFKDFGKIVILKDEFREVHCTNKIDFNLPRRPPPFVAHIEPTSLQFTVVEKNLIMLTIHSS